MPDKIRIILVDDQQLIRESWKGMLNSDDRFLVVAQCTNSAEAIIECRHRSADVILLNINRPIIEGIWETEDLIKGAPQTKVIVISDHDSPRFVDQLLEAGVSAVVSKSSSFNDLKETIVKLGGEEAFSGNVLIKRARSGKSFN